MRRSSRSNTFLHLAVPLLGILFPQAASAQQIQGRVAGDPELYPVAGATIQLQGTTHRALSDSLGSFFLNGVPEGRYLLTADHPSFRPVRDSVEVVGTEALEWLVVMVPQPFELEGIEARAGLTAAERRQRGAASAHYITLNHADLVAYEERGAARLEDLLWTHPRLSRWIRHDLTGNGVISGEICLQYPRPGVRTVHTETTFIESECKSPAVYLDDAFFPDMGFIENLSPSEIQSLELMPPSEARYRFGLQADNGALVITTMMGAAESAARRAAAGEAHRRHLVYLGVGTASGIFGSVVYASATGLFGSGASFNSDVLPVAGVVVLGVALGELTYRLFR